LKRIEQTSDCFTNAVPIAASSVAGLLVETLQVVPSERLLANNRKCANVAAVDILDE